MIDELVQSIEKFAHLQSIRPTLYLNQGFETLEIRVTLRGDDIDDLADSNVRKELYLRAEEVLASVESQGWRHMSLPKIELGGTILTTTSSPVRVAQHECEIRMDVVHLG